jgi:hypothetical protein
MSGRSRKIELLVSWFIRPRTFPPPDGPTVSGLQTERLNLRTFPTVKM